MSWEKPPALLVPAWFYVTSTMIISALISSGINCLVAWLMYSNDVAKISMWAFPDTIAGDLAITAILLWLITWFIGSGLAIRDTTLRYPIGIKKESIPTTWKEALRKTPFFIPCRCGSKESKTIEDSLTTVDVDAEYPSENTCVNFLARQLSHAPPLCVPLADVIDESESHATLTQAISHLTGDDHAGGEPIAACCSGTSLLSEFIAVWPFICLTVIFVSLPFAGLLTIKGSAPALWSLSEIILMKGLYGGLIELPIAWLVAVSVLLWHSRRRNRLLRESRKDVADESV